MNPPTFIDLLLRQIQLAAMILLAVMTVVAISAAVHAWKVRQRERQEWKRRTSVMRPTKQPPKDLYLRH